MSLVSFNKHAWITHKTKTKLILRQEVHKFLKSTHNLKYQFNEIFSSQQMNSYSENKFTEKDFSIILAKTCFMNLFIFFLYSQAIFCNILSYNIHNEILNGLRKKKRNQLKVILKVHKVLQRLFSCKVCQVLGVAISCLYSNK